MPTQFQVAHDFSVDCIFAITYFKQKALEKQSLLSKKSPEVENGFLVMYTRRIGKQKPIINGIVYKKCWKKNKNNKSLRVETWNETNNYVLR